MSVPEIENREERNSQNIKTAKMSHIRLALFRLWRRNEGGREKGEAWGVSGPVPLFISVSLYFLSPKLLLFPIRNSLSLPLSVSVSASHSPSPPSPPLSTPQPPWSGSSRSSSSTHVSPAVRRNMELRARSKSPKLRGAASRNSATPMIESASGAGGSDDGHCVEAWG